MQTSGHTTALIKLKLSICFISTVKRPYNNLNRVQQLMQNYFTVVKFLYIRYHFSLFPRCSTSDNGFAYLFFWPIARLLNNRVPT